MSDNQAFGELLTIYITIPTILVPYARSYSDLGCHDLQII